MDFSIEPKAKRSILVTCALLYANGPLHLGHLLEHIQADIWVRFQRLRGHSCHFIGGEDAHGTAIMLAADKSGITPERLIQRIFSEHHRDLQGFSVFFDHFYTTHSTENQRLVEKVFNCLSEKGEITTRITDQAYDPEVKIFLPDRYIKGTCPRCEALDQYGDNCEVCGTTYSASDLKQPVSALSGKPPVFKPSQQYCFQLSQYHDFLLDWISNLAIPKSASHKLQEWFQQGLKEIVISREAPYFGFLIPGMRDKYFYVWMDAPIGYIAIFEHYRQDNLSLSFEDYWIHPDKTELYHVIGKDIVNFHALLWPALLKGSGFRLPTSLFIHGYLTIEGLKMSKSRGTFILARDYLQQLNPEYLRYYFATKLNDTLEDVDLNLADFRQKVNSDLVGKFINIASRCAKLINLNFGQQLSSEPALVSHPLIIQFLAEEGSIANFFESRQYNDAMRWIMSLSNKVNQFLEEAKPWILVRSKETRLEAQNACTIGLNLFRILLIYLKPVLPTLTREAEQLLNVKDLQWSDLSKVLIGTSIQPYHPLLQRISLESIQDLTLLPKKH